MFCVRKSIVVGVSMFGAIALEAAAGKAQGVKIAAQLSQKNYATVYERLREIVQPFMARNSHYAVVVFPSLKDESVVFAIPIPASFGSGITLDCAKIPSGGVLIVAQNMSGTDLYIKNSTPDYQIDLQEAIMNQHLEKVFFITPDIGIAQKYAIEMVQYTDASTGINQGERNWMVYNPLISDIEVQTEPLKDFTQLVVKLPPSKPQKALIDHTYVLNTEQVAYPELITHIRMAPVSQSFENIVCTTALPALTKVTLEMQSSVFDVSKKATLGKNLTQNTGRFVALESLYTPRMSSAGPHTHALIANASSISKETTIFIPTRGYSDIQQIWIKGLRELPNTITTDQPLPDLMQIVIDIPPKGDLNNAGSAWGISRREQLLASLKATFGSDFFEEIDTLNQVLKLIPYSPHSQEVD